MALDGGALPSASLRVGPRRNLIHKRQTRAYKLGNSIVPSFVVSVTISDNVDSDENWIEWKGQGAGGRISVTVKDGG